MNQGQYADFKSLTGDASDNIKGADKVGPKTASSLLSEFGNLENIILNAEAIKKPSACVKIGHIIFLLFSNFTIQSNCNQLFLLKGASSGQLSNCFYDFLGEIIMTPEINLYSSIFIDTDLLYQFPKFFWAVLIQKLNTLGICF